MPTDPPESDSPTDPPAGGGAPPKADPPPAPTPDELRTFMREELAKMLGAGAKPEGAPDLSTDKKLEAYVEKLVREGMETIRAAEAAAGGAPPTQPDPSTPETPEPEGSPETKTTWQTKLQKFLWGEVVSK